MMKRLLLTFGLVIAFFVSSVQASIYDTASSHAPKSDSVALGNCSVVSGNNLMALDACKPLIKASSPFPEYECDGYTIGYFDETFSQSGSYNVEFVRVYCGNAGSSGKHSSIAVGYWSFSHNDNSKSCPPDEYQFYTFGHDSNQDGEIDACYNPDELDNASQCQNQVGNMLPALSNGIADKVCKTDPNTGASCGYSRPANSGNPSYALDLEMNCFGDGENVPEYQPESLPEPETCNQVNNGLMVCKADPLDKCDASGACQDQCGFVNDVFMCFHQCSGDQCSETTPPTVEPEPPTPEFCQQNTTHPDCTETPPPTPEFCQQNPTHPDCVTTPEPEPDGDLTALIEAVKEIGDKIDEFFTLEGTLPTVEVDPTLFQDFFTPLIDEKNTKIEENKEQIKTLLEESPLRLGTPSFTSGSYSPTEFVINQGGSATAVSFNLFEKLGANAAYVRGAILFAAAMLAAMIVLSSGRGR